MLKDKEKDKILNPSGRPPILQIGRSKMCKEIGELMSQYVTEILRGADMLKKFKGIRGEIVSFYHNTSLELSKMENEWTYDQGSKVSVCDALETSPLCLPEFAMSIVLSWNQFLIPKQKLIDEIYYQHLSSVRMSICNHLQSSYGLVLNDLLDKVTADLLPERIKHLQRIIEQYQGTHEKYFRMQKLEKLASNVQRVQETATEIQNSIEYMKQVEEASKGLL